MRNRFAELLHEAMGKDENIWLLCGDLGYSVLDKIAESYPDRFINIGISEQNMIGMAAGLALSGKKVFTYSIVNFAIARCLEQIRNDICYHNLDVTCVSVGGGLAYGNQGYTHLGVEDVALTRSLPNMEVYVPADRPELEYCLNDVLNSKTPKYLRMARGGEPDVHEGAVKRKGTIEVLPKQDVNILCQGTVLNEAIQAAKDAGAGLFSVPVMDDAAFKAIQALGGSSRRLITAEEHVKQGALGSFAAEALAETSNACTLTRLSVDHTKLDLAGDQAYLRAACGIDAKGILKVL